MFNKKQRQLLLSSLLSLAVFLCGIIFFPDQKLQLSWNTDRVGVTQRQEGVVPEVTNATELLAVARVVDGDTIRVMLDGREQVVRLANINTPESVDPRRGVECMGREASAYMAKLATGQRVSLETDPSQSAQDRYGRLVRFVFLANGSDLGLTMISQGYAYSSPYGSKEHKYFNTYEQAQTIAKGQKLGLWSEDGCD